MGLSCSQSICRLEGGGHRQVYKRALCTCNKIETFEEFGCCHPRSHKASQESTLFITPLALLSPAGPVFAPKVRLHLNNNDLGFKSITSETKIIRSGWKVPGDASRLFFSCSDQQNSKLGTQPGADFSCLTLPLAENPCLSGWTGPRSWSSCGLSDHSGMSVFKRSGDACVRACSFIF